jgi:hypothetical protein
MYLKILENSHSLAILGMPILLKYSIIFAPKAPISAVLCIKSWWRKH